VGTCYMIPLFSAEYSGSHFFQFDYTLRQMLGPSWVPRKNGGSQVAMPGPLWVPTLKCWVPFGFQSRFPSLEGLCIGQKHLYLNTSIGYIVHMESAKKHPKHESPAIRAAKEVFEKRGGILRTTVALKAGIHRRTLYEMKQSGILETLSRGLYGLKEVSKAKNPSTIIVASRVPQGVLCLISALAIHEIGTQVPHEVYIALKKGAEKPKLDYPPSRFFWFSGTSFDEGIETKIVEGVKVKVYSLEKTVADCFKFRHQIGQDVAIEALREWHRLKTKNLKKLFYFARLCRVERVMKPYLEALL